jgi:hypothetical protein
MSALIGFSLLIENGSFRPSLSAEPFGCGFQIVRGGVRFARYRKTFRLMVQKSADLVKPIVFIKWD